MHSDHLLNQIAHWPHVARAWINPFERELVIKVAVGNATRELAFGLGDGDIRTLLRMAALGVSKAQTELRAIDSVTRRITS